ncbi:MAG: hypothetical protein ISS19_16420 [Bacteroidales bacterium]|nr:hypothetical protein [Bacteroidales bacterium]
MRTHILIFIICLVFSGILNGQNPPGPCGHSSMNSGITLSGYGALGYDELIQGCRVHGVFPTCPYHQVTWIIDIYGAKLNEEGWPVKLYVEMSASPSSGNIPFNTGFLGMGDSPDKVINQFEQYTPYRITIPDVMVFPGYTYTARLRWKTKHGTDDNSWSLFWKNCLLNTVNVYYCSCGPPPKAICSINGDFNDHVSICAATPIKLNFSGSVTCPPEAGKYYISIQRCDQWANGNGYTEYGGWLEPSQISTYGGKSDFDLCQYYNSFQQTFQAGAYYRIGLAAGQPWTPAGCVLHILQKNDPQPPGPMADPAQLFYVY